MEYSIYALDIETTGLLMSNSIIEISLIRMKDDVQRTFFLKADEPEDNIQDAALRVNGSKKEDILWKTSYGRETYKQPESVIAEIENFVAEDNDPRELRVLLAQNGRGFDMDRLINLWAKYDQKNTFPFNDRLVLDTLQQELFINNLLGTFQKWNNLKSLCERYGVKNAKAHSAAADTRAVADVYLKQIARMKKLLAHG